MVEYTVDREFFVSLFCTPVHSSPNAVFHAGGVFVCGLCTSIVLFDDLIWHGHLFRTFGGTKTQYKTPYMPRIGVCVCVCKCVYVWLCLCVRVAAVRRMMMLVQCFIHPPSILLLLSFCFSCPKLIIHTHILYAMYKCNIRNKRETIPISVHQTRRQAKWTQESFFLMYNTSSLSVMLSQISLDAFQENHSHHSE